MNFACKALVGLCLTFGSVASVSAQDMKMTYSSYSTPGWANVQSDLWMLDEIKKRSNGRIDFETYFGGALMGPRELVPATGQGVLQIANVPAQYTPDLLPLSDVVQPFITDKIDAASHAFRRLAKTNEALKEEYAKQNLKLLYTQVVSSNILVSNKIVKKPEDLAGMRIRAQSTVAEVIKEFGGTPVAMAWSEAVDLFSRQGLDGLSSAAFDISVISGTHEVAANYWDFGGAGTWATISTVMNLDTYNNLPDDLKKIIDDVSLEAEAKYLELLNKSIDDAVAKVKEAKNLTVTIADDASRKAISDVAAGAREKWIEKNEAKGLPARGLMEEYIALVREEEAKSTFVPGLKRLSTSN